MFIIDYFRYAFKFSKFFEYVKEKWWKVFIFFLIVSMISLFPMNLLIVQQDGWRLDFIEQSFIDETPEWQLPETYGIRTNKLSCQTDLEYTYQHGNITYIFNYQGNTYDTSKKQILLTENKIIYTNGQGAYMTGYNYRGFESDVNFKSLNLAVDEDRSLMYESFGNQLEASFGSYVIFYTLLVNIITNVGLYTFFVLIMSLVIQLFRFGYTSFMTYPESMKLVVFSMGIPSLISFVIGFLEPSFAPVVFQFGIGIILMVVMLKYGKKTFK